MPLSAREKSVLENIREWEKGLLHYEANDFQFAYGKYLELAFSRLPEKIQQRFFSIMDNWLFHLNGIIQGSQLQMDAKERILASGRIFQKDLHSLQDLKQLEIDQLQYIADQQIARHRLYSLVQGGLSGTGNTLLLGADIPLIVVINLRIVQLIAMTYGFEVNTPYEMMTSLKVFHTATQPPAYQKEGWFSLMDELEVNRSFYFYEGSEEIININCLQQPMQQLLKALVILFFRRKLIKGVPFAGIVIGAGANYQLTRKVTSFAHNFYQLRYVTEKEGDIE